MSYELKPCPFCGGEAATGQDTSLWWLVWCQDCGFAKDELHDRSEAIAAWNRRALPDREALIEALRGYGGYELVHDCADENRGIVADRILALFGEE